jgi:cytoskeletal protein CcmA (bactofilin family)
VKQIYGILAVLTLALLIGIGITSTARATAFYSGSEDSTVRIEAGKTVDGSAYVAGSNVVVEGTVNGDLYCAGDTVTVDGTINGDVICAASTLKVSGTLNGDIRVVGKDITLDGVVTGNALVGGSTVKTKEAFILEGDMTVGAETLTLDGVFGRDVLIGAGSVALNGAVSRNVTAHTESISVGDAAVVDGDLWYKAESSASVSDTVVAGDTTFERAEETDDTSMNVTGAILSVLGFMFLAIVGVLVMPRFVHTASLLAPRDALLAFLIGLVAVIVTPIVAFIFALTWIGLFAGFVLMMIWLLAMLVSGVFASYYVGSLVLRKRATNAVVVALVGSLALSVAMLIPFINVLVFIAMLFTGVGMQVAYIRHQFSKDPYTIA